MVCTGNLCRKGRLPRRGQAPSLPGETLDPFFEERLTQQHQAAKAFLRPDSLWCRSPRHIATTCTRDRTHGSQTARNASSGSVQLQLDGAPAARRFSRRRCPELYVATGGVAGRTALNLSSQIPSPFTGRISAGPQRHRWSSPWTLSGFPQSPSDCFQHLPRRHRPGIRW